MKKNDMMMWLLIAGGAGLAYWYVTNYGPNGEVKTAGGLTWWDTWFKSAPGMPVGPGVPAQAIPAPSTSVPSVFKQNPPQYAPPATALPPVQSQPAPQTNPVVTQPAPPAPPSATSPSTLADQLYAASGGMPALTVSQWNWYLVRLQGWADAKVDVDLGDGGVPVSVAQYLQLRAASSLPVSLGDIVPVRRSMSFGGQGFGGAFGGKGSFTRKGWVN